MFEKFKQYGMPPDNGYAASMTLASRDESKAANAVFSNAVGIIAKRRNDDQLVWPPSIPGEGRHFSRIVLRSPTPYA
jgi:hypothetical protein